MWLTVELISASLIYYHLFKLNVDVVSVRTCAPSSLPKSQHLFFATLGHSTDGKQLSGPLLFNAGAINKSPKEKEKKKGEVLS